ncbi:MAG: O-antigen ligase [Parcubacteria group bacterium GW2011_GWA1_59_11]|nr:MAG: O-antigen ligase [Parcubacteria group bacterium GW2011_GWA1_59_11]
MNFHKFLLVSIKFLLIAAALTPIVHDGGALYPYIFPKTVFFRVLMEFALVLFAVLNIQSLISNIRSPIRWVALRSPLAIALGAFFLVAALSLIPAADPYRAFFGDVERSEGLFGLLHFAVFFLLTATLFERRDWHNFMRLFLLGGLIALPAALLQFAGVSISDFLPAEGRPGSFMGNPAFLSVYAMLLLAFGLLVAREGRRENFRPDVWLGLLLAALTVPVLLVANTRGALVGLGAGVLFALIYLAFRVGSRESGVGSRRDLTQIARYLLAGLAIFAGLFWFTRQAPVWQNIPGLDRLSQTSLSDDTTRTRLLAARTSWNAFKEKPVLGWGIENYSRAYNLHYEPQFAEYEEAWFDRAHNKIFDLLVMQGALGLLAYLAVFGLAFFALFRHRDRTAVAVLGGLLVAYFVQNLFLFDNTDTYLGFFAVLGFIGSRRSGAESQESSTGDRGPVVGVLLVAAAAVVALYSLYAWNAVPYLDTRAYIGAMKTKVGEKMMAASDAFLSPDTFVQGAIRYQFLLTLYDNRTFSNSSFGPLNDKALAASEEFLSREGDNVRYRITMTEVYHEKAKEDLKFFAEAERHIRRARELAPKRQPVLYQLAFNLAGQEKYPEAEAVARQAIELDPRVAKSHYQLALVLALKADDPKNVAEQQELRAAAERELDLAREMGFVLLMESDLTNMLTMYNAWGRTDKVLEVLEEILRRFPKPQYYGQALAVYLEKRDAESFIRIAEALKRADPALADDMDVLIDLARRGKWEILDNLE